MIKRLFVWVGMIAALTGCDRPRSIPDEKLVAITREIFLVNSFRENPLSGISMSDSADIYTPIFDKYGYKPKDYTYTIQNLSKRKSVRFTDIIDEVVAQLGKEDTLMQRQVALLDTIDRRIDERYKKIVYDTSHRVTRAADPEHPDVTIPVRPGRYRVEYTASLDSADRNGYVQYGQYVIDSSGQKTDFHYRGYTKGVRKRESIEVELGNPKVKELCIMLAKATEGKDKRPPVSLTIDSLRVTYYLPRARAYDSLQREAMNFHADLFGFAPQNDTLYVRNGKEIIGARDPDSTGLAARRDTLVRR